MIHYGSIQRIWRYVDFVIWCFLPFILILTLSVLIIYKLRQKSKNSQQRFSTNIKSDESMVAIFVLLFLNKFFFFLVENNIRLSKQKFNNQNIEMRSNQKSEVIRSRHRHITLMLLAVAVVFLLLTFPNSIYFVLEITYSFNQPPKDNNYNKWLRFHRLTILTVIMFQLSDLQHATNFYLYLLTSNKFRRSVIGIYQSLPRFLTCWCQQKKNSNLKLNKDQRDMSFRSSVSDTSMIIKNPRSQQQQSRKIFYSYNLLPSKSLTITTDLS
jgi:heme/copper-type cytochrome/quinol oxidase subunit 2